MTRSANELAAMLPPADRFIRAGKLRLHFLEWGAPDSRCLLLLHGGSANAHWWDFFAPYLADRFRLVALDLRGHGDSDWDPAANYGIETHAADVVAFADALHLDEYTVVGHSFGGLVGTALTVRETERVGGLVLVDSRLMVTARGTRFMSSLAKLPHPIYSSIEQAVQRFRLLPTSSSAPPDVMNHVARHVIRKIDAGWTLKFDRKTLSATEPCDLSKLLCEIRQPILVVRGADSDWLPLDVAAEWAASAQRACVTEIPAAHHHVMLDQPAALADAVAAFLANPVGE